MASKSDKDKKNIKKSAPAVFRRKLLKASSKSKKKMEDDDEDDWMRNWMYPKTPAKKNAKPSSNK